jgi:putative flippase GtrA
VSTPVALVRFGAVGLLSNVLLYVGYLAITALGMGHKSAVSVLYCVGVLQSFALNKRWTFRHEGAVRNTLARYWMVYLAAYPLNLLLLAVLVDVAGFPHQMVQAVLVALIAALTFVVQKFWVFRRT